MTALAVSDYETSLANPAYRHRQASETLVEPSDSAQAAAALEETVATGSLVAAISADMTPLQSELGHKRVTEVVVSWASTVQTAEQSENDVERVAAQRAILLAKRYALKKLSLEQEARLAILNERLKVLLPPVTEAELQVLEDMANVGRQHDDFLADLERRYNLG